jgi:purine-binding chemotaxis protein CheW
VEPVPLTPPHVIGIINLRGTPLVVLDSEILLRDMRTSSRARTTALVLGDSDLRTALAVDRVDGVMAFDGHTILAPADGGAEFCTGLIEIPGQPGFVSIISSEFLLQRIHSLRISSRPRAALQESSETP